MEGFLMDKKDFKKKYRVHIMSARADMREELYNKAYQRLNWILKDMEEK